MTLNIQPLKPVTVTLEGVTVKALTSSALFPMFDRCYSGETEASDRVFVYPMRVSGAACHLYYVASLSELAAAKKMGGPVALYPCSSTGNRTSSTPKAALI